VGIKYGGLAFIAKRLAPAGEASIRRIDDGKRPARVKGGTMVPTTTTELIGCKSKGQKGDWKLERKGPKELGMGKQGFSFVRGGPEAECLGETTKKSWGQNTGGRVWMSKTDGEARPGEKAVYRTSLNNRRG